MQIQWDITHDVSAESFGVDTQQTRVRAKSKAPCFSVVAFAAAALVCVSAAPVITLSATQQSLGVVSLLSVPRAQPLPGRGKRKERAEYAPDGQHGMSTARLGERFSALFTPIGDVEPDVDYSFT